MIVPKANLVLCTSFLLVCTVHELKIGLRTQTQCQSIGGIHPGVIVYVFAHLYTALRRERNMLDLN